jgi:formate hydrogenlyase transcriptional activator
MNVAARYQALLEVSESIATHKQIQTLVPELAVSLKRLVEFDGITVTLYHADRRLIELLLVHSEFEPPISIGHTFPVEDTPAILVLESHQPHYVPDLELDHRFPVVQDQMRRIGVQSYVIAPMVTARHGFLGGLNFGSLRKNAYTPEDVEFMAKVARQVAIAVENALTHEELARERDHLRVLLEVNNAVVSHLDTASLLNTITTSLRETLGIDFAGLGLFDKAGQIRRHVAGLSGGYRWADDVLPPGSPAHRACERL